MNNDTATAVFEVGIVAMPIRIDENTQIRHVAIENL